MVRLVTDSETDCIKESTCCIKDPRVNIEASCYQLLHFGGNSFLDEPLDLWQQVLGPFLRLRVATALAQDSSAPLVQRDGLLDVLPKD
eukprot:2006038-Amphidinium_carterae.1